jgi:atypical dual specificity phosphatase
VAARIGNRELWIANAGAIQPDHLAALDLTPEYVVSLNRTPTEVTTDYHPLKDAHVNDQQQFTKAVHVVRDRIQRDGEVIVNCQAGISRSSTVIATAIAAEDELSFETAVEEIKHTRKRADPHPKLQLNAQAYLATVVGRREAQQQLEELTDSTYPGCEDEETVETLLTGVPDANRNYAITVDENGDCTTNINGE